MADLAETETYEAGIYQLEITDPVIGGPDGIDNLQAKQLANRTNWLKAKIDSLLGLSVIHTATLKASPSDADEFGFLSSSAAWSLVKMTGTNLKAWLKTHFDTIYASLNSPSFTGKVTSTDTVVSVTSGVYSAVANVITVVLTVASHTVAVGNTIKVSGITNAQASMGGSNVVFNGYMIVTAQTSTTITYQIDTLIGTVGSTALTGAVSFSHGGLYLDSIPKVKSGANYYPIQGATAWVNFDGTTTPPTIRDSFNISAVVRTATGEFDAYYEDLMDKVQVAVAGSAMNIGSNTPMFVGAYSTEPTTAKVHACVRHITDGSAVNAAFTTLAIFGGKN